MSRLNTSPNVARPDDFYALLMELHDGLDHQQSALVNAKLILLLANHIGDAAVLEEALGLAHSSSHERPHASAPSHGPMVRRAERQA